MSREQKPYNTAGQLEIVRRAGNSGELRTDCPGELRADDTGDARTDKPEVPHTEKIGQVTLDYTYYPGEDQYSDGGIEDEMLRIAMECGEDEFEDVIVRSRSWPILYHFSHVRQNIIDWLPMTGQESVLEIGAGPGAITGALVKKARQVTCIDLSRKRSLINAYRHRDCGNLRLLVGNFQDIERGLEEQFDLITLIGVFEYAQYSIQSEDPFVEYLQRIRRHLKPGGRLVIAIENRLGLKYWAGATEDHTGVYFEGLEGYPTTDYVRTFSRPELEAVMRQSGFEKYEFYYPYPDYKLPEKLYSDAYLPKKGELNRNRQNLDRERMQVFNEERVYDSLEGSGLFPQFSNSFFVICRASDSASEPMPVSHLAPEPAPTLVSHLSPEPVPEPVSRLAPESVSDFAPASASEPAAVPRVLFTKYSNERSRRFRIRTDILEEDGKRRIRKTALEPEAAGHIGHIYDCYLALKEDLADTPLAVNECRPGKYFKAGDRADGVKVAENYAADVDDQADTRVIGTDDRSDMRATGTDDREDMRVTGTDDRADTRATGMNDSAEVSFPWLSGRTLEEELDGLLQKRRIGEVKAKVRDYFALFSDCGPELTQSPESVQMPDAVPTPKPVQTPDDVQTPDAVPTLKPALTPDAVPTPKPALTPDAVPTPKSEPTPDAVPTPKSAQTSDAVQTPKPARISEFVPTPEFEEVFGEVSFARPQKSRTVSDIDMIFSNVIETADGWELIDYEWTFRFPVPIRFLQYRCLHYYIQGNAARACGELDERQLMEEFDITQDEQRQFAAMERSFQKYILGGYRPIWKQYDDISDGVIEIAPLVREESLRKKRNPAAVWFDTGNGFAEESRREYPLARTEGTSLEIELPEGTKALCLRPYSGRCLVRLGGIAQEDRALAWTSNGSPADNGDLIFDTDDPRIEIRTSGDSPVWISFGVEPLTGFARELILNQHGRIRWMEQTKVWRLYQKLKGPGGAKP